MSWENALLIEFSNDVEKYEIEVTKIKSKQPTFFTVYILLEQLTLGPLSVSLTRMYFGYEEL